MTPSIFSNLPRESLKICKFFDNLLANGSGVNFRVYKLAVESGLPQGVKIFSIYVPSVTIVEKNVLQISLIELTVHILILLPTTVIRVFVHDHTVAMLGCWRIKLQSPS